MKAIGTEDEKETDAVPECGWNGKKPHKAWDHFAKWYRRHQRQHDLRVWPNLPRGRKRTNRHPDAIEEKEAGK